jgi:undecaprenyl diphosphate synthase
MAIKKIKQEPKKPQCVAMIMDGNRRWGKERNLESFKGHERGYDKIKEVADWCIKGNIPNIILYAFSIENWQRKEEEISYLMELVRFMLSDEKEIDFFKKRGVRISFIGDMSLVPENLRSLIKKTEEDSKELGKLHLALAFSYGGRREILNAAKDISKTKSREEIENFTEEDFSKFLWTGNINIPDPDLVIRTSGEMRLSNFLTWQSVYSELFFTKTYWPDFTHEEFDEILEEFSQRERRLGK